MSPRLQTFTLALVAALLGAGALATVERVAPGMAGGAERARIERVVHDYVLAHPEIVPQAMQRLQDGETAKVIAANRPAIMDPVGTAWSGNPKGDVTLVEYLDYNCTYCRASLPAIEQLAQDDPHLRIVYKDMPILSDESLTAAKLAQAAARTPHFKAFHDALYAGGPLSEASMAAAARTAGLDYAKLKAASAAPEIQDTLRANLALIRQLGITGTPGWVVGDRVLTGLLPPETIEKAVADARAKG